MCFTWNLRNVTTLHESPVYNILKYSPSAKPDKRFLSNFMPVILSFNEAFKADVQSRLVWLSSSLFGTISQTYKWGWKFVIYMTFGYV